MLSTATMIKLGKTYGNLMVDVRATNDKLTARVHRMFREVTGATEQETAEALTLAAGSAKIAIVMLLGQVNAGKAMQLIEQARGSVRQALTYVEGNQKQMKGNCSYEA
jgi:N-acetylmuramic acid 6-phosphate etherase